MRPLILKVRMSMHVIIPAAGSGSRVSGACPKQYLPLLGQILLAHTLAIFCRHPRITRVWLTLAETDAFWRQPEHLRLWQTFAPRLEILHCGGATRARSVCNTLAALHDKVLPEDWILTHDAARPCLSRALLDRLLTTLSDDPVGGLLAVPLADTLKRGKAEDGVATAQETLPRQDLWQAQTPQMFRYGHLCAALAAHTEVTDEASAMEAAGFAPRLVESDISNLKVTRLADFALAEWIISGQSARETQNERH
ncbi:MAG: 2-C-methyl-D-erythritol 4-phosphate cytidylyltransferase [Zoogloeaceae bacterium]|jgi:2-C-methyl-D-erythritol 4-phosphate cytidylyltransferase|nr:2-C-methyl-D-erythritol 4-phosphate cytidylyltransferase [Zoogloeaceae bacterium]